MHGTSYLGHKMLSSDAALEASRYRHFGGEREREWEHSIAVFDLEERGKVAVRSSSLLYVLCKAAGSSLVGPSGLIWATGEGARMALHGSRNVSRSPDA